MSVKEYALLYILILHQTTTMTTTASRIGVLLHILILHQTTTFSIALDTHLKLLHILILHQTTTKGGNACHGFRVASYLDSTSNHNWRGHSHIHENSCFISWFYIKPQRSAGWKKNASSCFISWFYIKPQRKREKKKGHRSCFISWFYIKPQQIYWLLSTHWCCFISWFYIKPQLGGTHQWKGACCFISWFYIKPQLISSTTSRFLVASYLDSTSNHNSSRNTLYDTRLLHILILHQTTTVRLSPRYHCLLLHILILHQTTTDGRCRCGVS